MKKDNIDEFREQVDIAKKFIYKNYSNVDDYLKTDYMFSTVIEEISDFIKQNPNAPEVYLTSEIVRLFHRRGFDVMKPIDRLVNKHNEKS